MAVGPATMQGRKIHAPVLVDFFSASSSTPSTSAFCAEYGMVGVPRGGMSSVSQFGLSSWNP